tara:strand:+ start:182 stop:331 length:150 start_codon:yes stop_codon:yes gene_type:complete
MKKVQQKQWQIFVGKVLGKLVLIENQRVIIDPLFPKKTTASSNPDTKNK